MKAPIFPQGSILQMSCIDLYGYNGREYHPAPEHVGLLGEVVRLESYQEDEHFEVPGDCDYTCYTVLTYEPEPRFLEWMDHEVKLVGVISPS